MRWKAFSLWLPAILLSLGCSAPTSASSGAPAERTYGEPNPLGARVRIQEVPALEKTVVGLYVENRSSKDWGETTLRFNDVYSHALADMKAGSRAVVIAEKFTASDGSHPPTDVAPKTLEVVCKGGTARFDLAELRGQKVGR